MLEIYKNKFELPFIYPFLFSSWLEDEERSLRSLSFGRQQLKARVLGNLLR